MVVFLIAAGVVGFVMLALGLISIWRGGTRPRAEDVVIVAVFAGAFALGVFLWMAPDTPAVPGVIPTPHGPPPPGWGLP